MVNNIYDGDPKIILTEDGSNMVFKGWGQPVMDGGIENAVFISWFSGSKWAGNVIEDDPNRRIESKLEEVTRQAITVTTLNEARNAAYSDLQWMINTGLVSEIETRVTNPNGNQWKVEAILYPPGRDALKLTALKNGNNWIVQKLDPAYKKV